MKVALAGAVFAISLGLFTGISEKSPRAEGPSFAELDKRLSKAERLARLLNESMSEVEIKYLSDVQPIESALLKRAVDPQMAKIAAWSIVRESEKLHLTGRYLSAIMQVENPWLIPDTTSFAGAVGLMQVMPFHLQYNSSCGEDLTDPATSVCFGADIFSSYLADEMRKAIRAALLRYNGCKKTPGCEVYADHVLKRVN